ncbi:hypothetical protein [Actinoallomurus soli]|uniref:hypothetical protein n=1 Tax=Actinoallomurus soli TaxID=2952535 RepID=UPI0020929108|nr:hypothetical protein [Actinoallomurus soli]MCO5969236.1 hypothetical protein [Actinoallomurus soli]
MSNGARHAWGLLLGVVLTAALAGLLIFGTYRLQHGFVMQGHKTDKWLGGGLLAGAAVVFALLVASRLSPLGSLAGGLILTGAGVLFFVSQKTTADLINRFPFKGQRVTLAGLEEEGFILFAGVGLLFASFFPSRWRRRPGADDDPAYEYGLPEPEETYGRRSTSGGGRGRHAARDDGNTPAYGTSRYAEEEPAATAYGQTEFDVPLYEPERSYGDRSPFSPRDEDGGTREMRRPR